MRILSRISKAVEKGRIEARSDQQTKESARSYTKQQIESFDQARDRALGAADAAQRAGDFKGYQHQMTQAVRNTKAMDDAARRLGT